MKKNLNESKELARWIGDSRHDTELEANIDTLTECLPCLIRLRRSLPNRTRRLWESHRIHYRYSMRIARYRGRHFLIVLFSKFSV